MRIQKLLDSVVYNDQSQITAKQFVCFNTYITLKVCGLFGFVCPVALNKTQDKVSMGSIGSINIKSNKGSVIVELC